MDAAVWVRRGVWVATLLSATACRMQPSADEPLTTTSRSGISGSEADGVSTAPSSDILAINGYDVTGSVSCLPLDAERHCIERTLDPVKARCIAAKGTLSRCEDCAQVCSVALKP